MELSKEQQDWLKKISSDVANTMKVPAELLTEEFGLAAVQQSHYALRDFPDALKTEAACIAASRQMTGWQFSWVPEALHEKVEEALWKEWDMALQKQELKE